MTEFMYTGDLREVPISVLAYIGDAVYELRIRLHLCQKSNAKSGALHRETIKWVRAAAQAAAVDRLLPLLSEAETMIYRRGRNSQPSSIPKNADPADYMAATGFEAVIGYLYLKGDQDRLDHLLEEILEDSIDEAKS